MEALDQLNDMIEELTKKADAQDETDKMKVDLEMQIERATKDVELSITNHLNRSCPSEVLRRDCSRNKRGTLLTPWRP